MTTLGLKNVNMLSKEQFDTVAEPAKDELWAIEAVEAYHDDEGNWYRVYPDGWCEQGGRIGMSTTSGYPKYTINLLKPFIDTNYSVQITGRWTGSSGEGSDYCYARTTTSISIVSVGYGSDWEARGYIA